MRVIKTKQVDELLFDKPVDVFLNNGIRLKGVLDAVSDKGDFYILSDQNGWQIVYKSNIVTIVPKNQSELFKGE